MTPAAEEPVDPVVWAWVSPGSLSSTSGRWSGFGLIPALVLTVEMEQHLEAGMPGF